MSTSDFFAAVKAGDLDAVKQGLHDIPDVVDQRDEADATPLHYAVLHGHRELVRLLAHHGADINHRDATFGATPTGWAIEYLRKLGGVLATEIDDLAYAIQRRDTAWVERFLTRFPHLRDQVDADGVPLKTCAAHCGEAQIDLLFNGPEI